MGALGFVMGLMVACGPLEPLPLIEPEVSDLQLTVDTLKTSMRDAQRTITELRAEVDSRRQELADLQIARAHLEGRVREAERRLSEARHVIDLQREELAGSRSERERVARMGATLQSRLNLLQAQSSRKGKAAGNHSHGSHGTGAASAGLSPKIRRQVGAVPTKFETPSNSADAAPLRVLVKPGDTLWRISRTYGVPIKRLMAMNELRDHHIQVGQALWLTE